MASPFKKSQEKEKRELFKKKEKREERGAPNNREQKEEKETSICNHYSHKTTQAVFHFHFLAVC
jgi:hypothetical protein